MKKEPKTTAAKKLEDAIERGDTYRDLTLHWSREAANAHGCLHQLRQKCDKLEQDLRDERFACNHEWVLRMSSESALAEERLRHQATKRLIPVVAFFSGVLGVVLLALYMWATRWAP